MAEYVNAMILGVPFKCMRVEEDVTKYSRKTLHFERDDGYAGWLSITGAGGFDLEIPIGTVIKITK